MSRDNSDAFLWKDFTISHLAPNGSDRQRAIFRQEDTQELLKLKESKGPEP